MLFPEGTAVINLELISTHLLRNLFAGGSFSIGPKTAMKFIGFSNCGGTEICGRRGVGLGTPPGRTGRMRARALRGWRILGGTRGVPRGTAAKSSPSTFLNNTFVNKKSPATIFV